MLSPLRYPGSKRRLAGFIQNTLTINNLKPQLFVEPFAGGASVSLHLLKTNMVERIGLVERDPIVASFWKVVFSEDVDWLLEEIENIEVTLEQWDSFKYKKVTGFKRQALACLFLNRTSFSGILAPSSGPLGGRKQESDHKLDCRFPRQEIIRRVIEAHKLKDRIAFIWNMTWESGIKFVYQLQRTGTMLQDIFFYLDPPFFQKADRLYTHYFEYPEHKQLRDVVLTLPSPWMLSYDIAPELATLYGNTQSNSAHVELLYSASSNGGNRIVKEVVITNLPSLPTTKISEA